MSLPSSTLPSTLVSSLGQLYGIYEFQASNTQIQYGYWMVQGASCTAAGTVLTGTGTNAFCAVNNTGTGICNGSGVTNSNFCSSYTFTKLTYGTVSFDGAGTLTFLAFTALDRNPPNDTGDPTAGTTMNYATVPGANKFLLNPGGSNAKKTYIVPGNFNCNGIAQTLFLRNEGPINGSIDHGMFTLQPSY
jgi:hypothetical protein